MKNLIALLLFVLIASCGKERTIQISAKNAATGEAYGGLHYVVGYSTTTGSGEKSHTVHSGNLDDNGLATVVVRVKRNRTYYVHVDEPENTCYNKFITMYFNSPFDEDGHFNFEFSKCAYLRQNIVNANCEGSSDTFNIRDRYTYTDWSGWISIEGCFSNTGGQYAQIPAGKRYFQWTVIRSSGITQQLDSIELQPGEYGELNINY